MFTDARRGVAIGMWGAATELTAHAGGLVHRDVKPANVLLEGTPGSEHAFLTDFGISRLVTGGTELTTTGRFVGTVDYVAPEQIAGERIDGRADIYSLACVAYHAFAGEPPFHRDTELATMFAHANAVRPRVSEAVPGLPRALDEAVARGMAQMPDDRFESAGELSAAVHGAVGTVPPRERSGVRARDATAPTRTLPAPARRRWIALAAGAAAVAAIVAAVLVVAAGDGDGAAPAPPERVATIDVGDRPNGLTVGAGRVWVASSGAGAVDVVDPGEDRTGRPIRIGGNPASVAVGFGSVWVVDHPGGAVLRLPLDGGRTGTTEAGQSRIEVGERPSDVAVDGEWVWVANEGSNEVSRIHPDSERVSKTVKVGDGPRSVATGGGDVWVTNIEGGSVTRIDPATAKRVGTPIELGERPNDVAVGGGSVWVTDVFNGTLSRIDPDSARVADELQVGRIPAG